MDRAPALTELQMGKLVRIKIYAFSKQPVQPTNLLSLLTAFRSLRILEIDILPLPASAADLKFRLLEMLSINSIEVPKEIATWQELLRIDAPNLRILDLGEWISI